MKITLYLELWLLHVKAEEKTVAFMFFFSVFMQSICSLGKKKIQNLWGIKWEGRGGTGWPILVANK